MAARTRAHAEANDHVRQQWLMRVEAEYRSAVLTQELTLWLMQAGASPDLIHDGLRIVEDELMHASGYQAEDYGSQADAAGETMDVDYPVDIDSSSSSMSTARSGPGSEAAEASQP